MHKFEDLEGLSLKELEGIKRDVLDKLHAEREKRYECIAAILWLEKELKRVKEENNA